MLNRPRRIRFGPSDLAPDRLVLADNLSVLAAADDGCLDAIYLDPPFATGTTRRGASGAAYADAETDPDSFTDWLLPRLEHCRRLLRPTGSLFVHLDSRAVHYVKVALDRLFGARLFVNEIIWCYSVGGKSRRRFGRKHDTILWYARGADYAFYPDAVRVPRKPASHMRLVEGDDGELYQEKTDRRSGKVYRYPVARGKVPEDWWTDIETLNRGDRERTGWPTQKPERLLERLLLATTAEGDRVADFFAGAGTTAAVAQRLGRGFLAVDREPKAFETAATRLEVGGRSRAAAGLPTRDLVLERPAQAASRGPALDKGARGVGQI